MFITQSFKKFTFQEIAIFTAKTQGFTPNILDEAVVICDKSNNIYYKNYSVWFKLKLNKDKPELLIEEESKLPVLD